MIDFCFKVIIGAGTLGVVAAVICVIWLIIQAMKEGI